MLTYQPSRHSIFPERIVLLVAFFFFLLIGLQEQNEKKG